MPFPSTGCQTCKNRRIKCDGTKPICQRCVKARRICLEASAARQARFSIHVENSYASGESKRPRGPRSSLTVLRTNIDLPSRALAYYLNYHLHALGDVPNNVAGCLTGCVAAWKDSGSACPMVDLALSSMALAIFSRTQRHPPAATEASSRYSRLLGLAREKIWRVSERTVDACLLTVLLMGRYEGATYRPKYLGSEESFKSMHTFSHHDGAMAILKVWNDELRHIAPTFIIKQSRRGLIRSYLLRHLPVPDWMQDGSRFGEHDLELGYDRIIVRLVNLRSVLAMLGQKQDLKDAKAEKLYSEAWELDQALEDWAARLPATYSGQPHLVPQPGPYPRKFLYSSMVYSYSTPGYGAIWCQYFATRMLVSSTRLKILDLLCLNASSDITYGQQRVECTTLLNEMADSLASSIPSCLEMFTVGNSTTSSDDVQVTLSTNMEAKPYLCHLAVWPLTIASGVECLDVMQQLWFRSSLAGIGRISGDGILECAETDQWAAL